MQRPTRGDHDATTFGGRPDALAGVDLRLIPSFVVLADELHFGRAAELLNLAQPALSQQVRRLEAQVGQRLFERDRRHVELNEAGRALLDPARRALRLLETGLDAVAAGGCAGSIRVGLSPAARSHVASALERELVVSGEDLRIEWREGCSEQLVDDLVDGHLDAAVTFCGTCPRTLDAVELIAAPADVALHVDDPLAARDVLDGAELDGYRVLVPAQDGADGYLTFVRRIWRSWTGSAPRIDRAHTTYYSSIPGPGVAGVVPGGAASPAWDRTTRFVSVAGSHTMPFDLVVRCGDDRMATRRLLRAGHAVASSGDDGGDWTVRPLRTAGAMAAA